MHKEFIFLAQTDTTAGFLSKDHTSINQIKKSNINKKLLKEYSSFKNLNIRLPVKFRAKVRMSKKTSFIVNNNSFRVVQKDNFGSFHFNFLNIFKCLYSSSANKSGELFDFNFAVKYASVIVFDKRGIYSSSPSKIFKLNNSRLIKIR